MVRAIDVHCRSEEHAAKVAAAVDELEGVQVLEWWDRTYKLHEGGKIAKGDVQGFHGIDHLTDVVVSGVLHVDEAGNLRIVADKIHAE